VLLLIFLLVPEAATQRHLEILSEIAEMLSDRELRERLKTEPDAAVVHKLISDWEAAEVGGLRPGSAGHRCLQSRSPPLGQP
jgi:hypothetical protein